MTRGQKLTDERDQLLSDRERLADSIRQLLQDRAELVEALRGLVHADDVKMGRKAVTLRLEIARALLSRIESET